MQSSPRIDELRQKFHENPRRYFAPLANEYRKAGDPEQAIAICRAHLAQQPGHMSGHVVYGQALYDAGRIDEARVVFQQALALDPENLIVLRHLGDIARRRGDVDEARNWYSRALDGDPQDAEVAAYLAELTEPLVVSGPAESAAVAPLAIAPEAPAAMTAAESAEAHAPVAATAPAGDSETAQITSAKASEESHIPDDSPYLEEAGATDASAEAAPVAEMELGDLSAESALEAEMAAADMEAEGAPAPATVEAEPEREDRGFRSTPAFESTPIVTRTLAELYLQQGYLEPALEIYRQLAEREPEDAGLRARLTELSGGEVGDKQPSSELWDTADSWSVEMFDESEDTDEIFGLSAMDDGPMAPAPEAPALDADETEAAEAETAAPGPPVLQAPGAKTPAAEVPAEEEPKGHPAPAAPAAPAAPEPRGITIHEFFATLGAMRPPTAEASHDSDHVASSDVAFDEAESPPASSGEDASSYPYADDAFATLFENAPVSPEDSRAAAALSDAVAHTAPVSTVTTSAEPWPGRDAGATRAGEQPAQESEEDIRRFREWLEGLANS